MSLGEGCKLKTLSKRQVLLFWDALMVLPSHSIGDSAAEIWILNCRITNPDACSAEKETIRVEAIDIGTF